MNLKATVLCAFLLASVVSCSDTGNEPPVIENLTYALHAQPAEESKSANVTGTFDIRSENGETLQVNTAVYAADGRQISAGTIPLDDASLRTATALGFLVEIPLSRKGDYTFHVSITDSKKRRSNPLIGSFKVTDVF